MWATSDLHVGYADNRRIVTDDLHPAGDGDWLIVAGDVAERPADVEWALATLAGRFAKVIWVAGQPRAVDPARRPGPAARRGPLRAPRRALPPARA